MANTTLYTPRTLLTLLTEADLPAMEALAREPDTFKYIKKLRVMSPEQYTQFLHTKLEQIRTGAGYHWAVWLRTPAEASSSAAGFTGSSDSLQSPSTGFPAPHGPFIGAVNLNPIRGALNASGQPKLQIGCQLKRDFWGQGFASELTARLLHFAIYELKLPAVYGVFEKDNNISRRLLEKMGFVFEESTQEQELIIETHKFISPLPDTHTPS